MRHAAILLSLSLSCLFAGCLTTAPAGAPGAAVTTPGRRTPPQTLHQRPRHSAVRVTVTSQSYDFYRPWNKQPPVTKKGLGAVINERRILVTATLIENAAYVELENLENGSQAPATVECIDYMANLAILRCDRPDFLDYTVPLLIDDGARIGDRVSAWQFEDNGTPFLTDGVIRSIETAPYPFDERSMLVYRVEISLSQLTSSYVIPMIRRGRLTGLLMGYNTSTRIMTLVSTPVIRHFLEDLKDGRYDGFPQAGIGFAYLDDPQFRRYLGVEGLSGVYVTSVRPGCTAAAAGLQRGDVIIAIDRYTIDRNGEYIDPEYGKLSLSHLVSTRCFAGDTLTFRVIRDGETKVIEVPVEVFRAEDSPIPPYVRDRAPQYVIENGMVFTELSREYLRAWGGKWESQAPGKLRHYDLNQWELLEPGRRLVILSHVLPSRGNIGYHQFGNLVVAQVNGRPIHRLADLVEALEQPQNGFHVIRFEDQDRVVFLRVATIEAENRLIQQRYQLPALMRLTN